MEPGIVTIRSARRAFIHYECVLIKTTFNNTAPVAEAGTPTEELGVASPSKGRGHSMKGRGQS